MIKCLKRFAAHACKMVSYGNVFITGKQAAVCDASITMATRNIGHICGCHGNLTTQQSST